MSDKNRREILRELEILSPLLKQLKDRDVRQVPSGYFENLPTRLSNRWREDVGQSNGGIVQFLLQKNFLRIAAAVVVLIGSIWVLSWHNSSSSSDKGYEWAETEVLEFLMDDPEYIDLDYLIELAYDDIYDPQITASMEDQIGHYLEDNIDDLDAFLIIDYE